MKLKTGARGLRTIMESMVLDLMYEVPSRSDVDKVVISAQCVEGEAEPHLILKKDQSIKKAQ